MSMIFKTRSQLVFSVRAARSSRLWRLTRCALGLTLLIVSALAAADDSLELQIEQAQQTARQNPGEAIAILDRLIDQDSAARSLSEQADLYAFRAELKRDMGALDLARVDAEQARALADRSGEADIRAETLRVLGTIDAEAGDVNAALAGFHAAWALLDGAPASPTRLRLAIALGVGHQMLENHARAVDYLDRGLGLARELGDRSQEATILGNLAIARNHLDGPQASIALHQQALEIFREIENDYGEANQLANLCDRSAELGWTAQGQAVCLQAVDRLEALGNARLLAGVRASLGTLYQQQGNLDAALDAYLLSLGQAEGRIPTVERDVLERLARLHAQRGEPDQALSVYQRYMTAREALWEERNRQTIEGLEVQFQLRERERQLRLSRAESELQAIRLTQQSRLLVFVTFVSILLVLLVVFVLRGNRERARLQGDLAERNKELESAVRTIGRLATRDPLTELHNRRAFITIVEKEIARSKRNDQPMSILMVDIDHFKHLNDHHGHGMGDLVLKDIASLLRSKLREQDALCRWGGEEFVMLLPDTDLNEALRVAERARQSIDQTIIEAQGATLHVTVTIGVARVGDDLDQAIDAADQAMYEGKRAGRNRVVVEDNGTEGSE